MKREVERRGSGGRINPEWVAGFAGIRNPQLFNEESKQRTNKNLHQKHTRCF